MANDPKQTMEAYLSRLRRRLRGVNNEEVREIVEELRGHILDKAAASGGVVSEGVDSALASLGSPEDLASQYMTADLPARAELGRSPVRILRTPFRWASLSFAGLLVLLGSLMSYFFGVIFVLWAVLKPLYPQTAGVTISRDGTGDLAISVHLWPTNAPVGSTDVLGWWILPIGLLAGCGLTMLTTRFAIWCARRDRRTSALS